MNVEDFEELVEFLNKVCNSTACEEELIALITKSESDMLEGVNADGETVIVGIEQGVGIRLSTHQSNGYIRTDDFYLDYDEDGYPEILRTESYTK